jgi:hypothetical protein
MATTSQRVALSAGVLAGGAAGIGLVLDIQWTILR